MSLGFSARDPAAVRDVVLVLLPQIERRRREGWEARLQAIIEDARARPYVLGEHDCFRVTCRVIAALTGRDLWPAFRGYTTRRESLAALARHGASFETAFDAVLGLRRISLPAAGRGDIAACIDRAGEKHLCIIVDHRAALLLADGLQFIPKARCHAAWRVV